MATKPKAPASPVVPGTGKVATPGIPDQKQIDEKLTTINSNIITLKRLVDYASETQAKTAKDANAKVEKIMRAIDADFKATNAFAQKVLDPNSPLVKEAQRLNSKVEISKIVSSMSVLPVPTQLTYLARFLDFWKKSVKEITKKIGRSGVSKNIVEDVGRGANKGHLMRDEKGEKKYVSSETMNDFLGAIMTHTLAASSSRKKDAGDPTAAIKAALASKPTLQAELGSVITVLGTLLGAGASGDSVYTPTAADINAKVLAQRVAFSSGYSTLKKSLDELASVGSNPTTKKDKDKIDSLNKKVASSLKKITEIAESASSTLEVTYGPAGSQQTAIFLASEKAQMESFFQQNNHLITDISYTDKASSVITNASSISQEDIDRSRSITKERKLRSAQTQMTDFLKSVTINSIPPGKKKELFNDREISSLGALFFAAFANLPKFEQAQFKDMGFDKSVLGSQALAVARLNLARIMEKIIAEKVIGAIDKGYSISTADAVYKRERQKNMSFTGSPSDILNKILFAISPTEFPIDWTLAFATEQQIRLRVDEKDIGVNFDNFYIDPNLQLNKKAVAQGDHVMAHNRGGATIPRNFLALSSSLNQSKQDAASGMDQILQTVETYNRLFSSSPEFEWINKYERAQEIIGIDADRQKISEATIEAKRKKIESSYPSKEIAEFRKDVVKLNALNTQAQQIANMYDSVFNTYLSIYKEIQSQYNSLNSELNTHRKEMRDILQIGVLGKDLSKDSEFKRMITATDKIITDLQKLLPKGRNSNSLIKLSQKYESMKAFLDQVKQDAVDNKKENQDRVLVMRQTTDKYIDELQDMIENMRQANLQALNTLFSSFAANLGQVTADLQKGEQKYRGSRSASALQKSDFPMKPKVENSLLYKHKEAYEELIGGKDGWNAATAEYNKLITPITSGQATGSNLMSSLKTLEDMFTALLRANEFVLFSEFFE